jgi:hypothetical protein
MANAVELWDMAEAGDVRGVSSHRAWLDMQRAYRKVQRALYPDGAPQRDLATERVMAARCYVQVVLNERIEKLVAPRLLWNNPDFTHLQLHIRPNSLLGALWLQFVQAVNGNKKYRRCQECGAWFVLDPATARKSRLFCSDLCRNRAFRRKKALAKAGAS